MISFQTSIVKSLTCRSKIQIKRTKVSLPLVITSHYWSVTEWHWTDTALISTVLNHVIGYLVQAFIETGLINRKQQYDMVHQAL